MGVEARFNSHRASDLRVLLSNGDLDLGIGGLVDAEGNAVVCVSARHVIDGSRGAASGPDARRQMFYPNVWWLGRGDPLWHCGVALFLKLHRWGVWRQQTLDA